MRNKLWYFGMASQEQFAATCKDIHKVVDVRVGPNCVTTSGHDVNEGTWVGHFFL